MPRQYKPKTFRKRKSGRSSGRSKAIAKARSRRSWRRSTTYLPRGVVNKRALVKLTYVDSAAQTSNTGSITTYNFKSNGMYDPNFTGTGHQPLGFDQMMAQYNHFTVIGSKITVTFDVQPTATVPVLVAIQSAAGTSFTPTSIDEICEQPRIHWKLLPVGNGNSRGKLSHKFSAKKFFSTKAIVAEDSYKGSASIDPVETAFYRILMAAENAGTVTVNWRVRITYIAVFSEPKHLAQS